MLGLSECQAGEIHYDDATLPRLFILIDALDESGLATDNDNNDLLLILQHHVAALPPWVCTGRPESQLQACLCVLTHIISNFDYSRFPSLRFPCFI